MLCLTRKPGQTVTVTLPGGDVITVEVVEVRHGKTMLGFTAPDSVQIHRSEVVERMREEQRILSPDLGGES